ncbi:MBL fold metallo-hydrolase [Sphingomonas oleivorans]|nr:MBL fold metallo-hydrolase [Sphingomonas oleivorans]
MRPRLSLPALAAAMIATGTVALPIQASATTEPSSQTASPGVYRMTLGAFTIIALSDGSFDLPTDQLLIEPRPGEVKELLDRAGLPAAVPTAINAFLIDTGTKRILVDAGSGALLGPSLGKLLDNLRAAGYRPEQIDELLLTHLHPDHVGGLADGGRMTFPNAVIRVDRSEAGFWLDKANRSRVDDSVKGSFDAALTSLQPYIAAGRLKQFEPGEKLEPGIMAVAMPGHTAGHTVYRIESRGQTMMMWGDIVHVAAVQFPDPRITIHFDSVTGEAEAARETAFGDATRKGYWVAASHIAFPGIGHVGSDGTGYMWKPADRNAR